MMASKVLCDVSIVSQFLPFCTDSLPPQRRFSLRNDTRRKGRDLAASPRSSLFVFLSKLTSFLLRLFSYPSQDTYSNKSWCVVAQQMFALKEVNQMVSRDSSLSLSFCFGYFPFRS